MTNEDRAMIVIHRQRRHRIGVVCTGSDSEA